MNEEWERELDKQVAISKANNLRNYKACKSCGDTGKELSSEYSNNMKYLCMSYCTCNTGINLRNKHNEKKADKC